MNLPLNPFSWWMIKSNVTRIQEENLNPLHVIATLQANGYPSIAKGVRAVLRLEYLRRELRAERMSWGEFAELEDLKDYIDPGDVELLEAAGVPEFPE